MKWFVNFLLFVVTFSRIFADEQCNNDPNAYWSECVPNCGPTCYNVSDNQCEDKECKAGCACVDNHFKNSEGECVKRDLCERCNKKGKYFEFLNCGSDCPRCEKWDQPCAMLCWEGCFCIAGYLQNANNQCVEEEQCKTKNETLLNNEENSTFNSGQ